MPPDGGRMSKTQFDHAGSFARRFTLGQVDFDIVMFEEDSVGGCTALYTASLATKSSGTAVRVVAQFQSLLWRRDQVQQLGR